MNRAFALLYTLSLIVASKAYGRSSDSAMIFTVGSLELKENKVVQQLRYKSSSSGSAIIKISCYQLRGNDSLPLYSLLFKDAALKEGYHTLDLDISKADSNKFLDNSFIEAVKRLQRLPAGVYHNYLVVFTDSGDHFERTSVSHIDSTLAIHSNLRNKVNKTLSGIDPFKMVKSTAKESKLTEDQLNAATSKITRRLRKSGITTRPEMHKGKAYAALYYEQWFLGRYELVSAKSLENRIAAEYNTLKDAPTSLVNNNLEDFKGVNSQVRDLFKNDKDKFLTGIVDISAVFGNGQEPNSQQDNNLLELRGDFQTEVLNIPVSIEGYYTTQDERRQAKASYLRFHYDVVKNKEKLSRMISGYKSKYSETVAKGQGLEGVYQGYINNLTAEQLKLNRSFSDYGIDAKQLSSTNQSDLLNEIASQIDTSALLGNDSLSNSASKDYQKAARKKDSISRELQGKYQRLQENQKKIDKYTTLLRQYKEQLTLDSGLVYCKLQQLEKKEETSCKELAKAASDLLPEGKAKKFIYGLTNFDIGILNQYESKYTASGQTLKGGSVGYDFGIFKTSLTLGKTEYIAREGTVDRYSSTAVHTEFKPFLKQKLGLIYYTYSPSKQLVKDDFFKDDGAVPSFQKPVHIVSVTHEGVIRKNLSLQNELAVSYQNRESNNNTFSLSSSAINTALEYSLTKRPVSFKGEWEHVGRDFQNSVLPYIRSATERYTVATKADFFKSFLSVGIQYNFLKQETFASTAHSTKWGFDIRTNSKRYPNLYASYKPFTTFRAYNDTFSIPQRPLAGEVWIVKGSYQIKKKSESHRFTIVYNQNSTSTADSQQYNSRTLQVGYIYLSKINALNVNSGWMQLPKTPSAITAYEGLTPNNSYFINASINRRISKDISMMLGQDFGVAPFGLQRTATTAGVNYSFRKMPLQMRLQARYSNIKTEEAATRTNLWQGQAGVTWRFKTRINSKKED